MISYLSGPMLGNTQLGFLAGALWLLVLVAAMDRVSRLRRGGRGDAPPGDGQVRPVPFRPGW